MLAGFSCQSTHMLRDQTVLHCTHYSIASTIPRRIYSGSHSVVGYGRQWQLHPLHPGYLAPKRAQFTQHHRRNLTIPRLLVGRPTSASCLRRSDNVANHALPKLDNVLHSAHLVGCESTWCSLSASFDTFKVWVAVFQPPIPGGLKSRTCLLAHHATRS